ncbi:AI-2E family transporter [Candidatus Woesebacteria bacterium]|nr:AI-2E family transporter [Candidatus Woesebacteria bacterium]
MKKISKKKLIGSPKILSEKIVDALVSYIKTQLLLTGIIAMISWALLSLLNVRYAVLLSIFTGALSAAPIFGMLISSVIVALVAIFDSTRFLPNLPKVLEGLAILCMFGLFNFLIDYFVSPYLIGKSTNINPFLLLIVVIIGTAAFGIIGALLAVPVMVVIKTVIDHYNHVHYER